jgi:hypothetical protein
LGYWLGGASKDRFMGLTLPLAWGEGLAVSREAEGVN